MNFFPPPPPLFSASLTLCSASQRSCVKKFLVDQLDAVFFGERFRAFAIHHDVSRFFHDQARESYRVLDVLQRADRARFQRLPIHDRRVQLVRPGAGKDRAFAGIEMRIVLEHAHGRFGRVETRSAALQNFVAGGQRALQSGAIFLSRVPASSCCARSFRRRRESPVQIFFALCS